MAIARGANTRGVRNNNPGNIVHGIKWDGLAPHQTDPRFDVFVSATYGIRALMRLLLAYQDFHGLTTLRGQINRWAPPGGADNNDPSAYVLSVCESVSEALGTQVGPDDEIDYRASPNMLRAVAAAIIKVECAGYMYPDSIMNAALAMAEPAKGA